MWSRHILWGNHMLKGGVPVPSKNAFPNGVVWGSALTPGGDNIVWGSQCGSAACDNVVWGSSAMNSANIVWGSSCQDKGCDNVVWSSGAFAADDNIVWGSDCGGADCDNVVWGSFDASDDNIVWGSAEPNDNIVWGSSARAADNIVWGSSAAPDDNIVWGSSADSDNIVWGSSAKSSDNIVWASTVEVDNIVWGSDCDTSSCDNIVWGNSSNGSPSWADLSSGAGGTIGPNSHMDRLTDGQLLRLIVANEMRLAVPIPTPPAISPPTLTSTSNFLSMIKTMINSFSSWRRVLVMEKMALPLP